MTIQDMAAAMKARDDGISSSFSHAEQDAPGWGERAYQAVKKSEFLSKTQWTMERARIHLYAFAIIDPPASGRAWGSVTKRLIRDGIIEPVGHAPAASSHGSAKPMYRMVRT